MSKHESRLADTRARLRNALLTGADTRPFRAALAAVEAAMQRDAEAALGATRERASAQELAVLQRAEQIASQARQSAEGAA